VTRSLETVKREKILPLYAVTSFAKLMTCAKACRLILALVIAHEIHQWLILFVFHFSIPAINHCTCRRCSRYQFWAYWHWWSVLRFVLVTSNLIPASYLIVRFAADVFTEGLMLLTRSINLSAPTLFHALLSPHSFRHTLSPTSRPNQRLTGTALNCRYPLSLAHMIPRPLNSCGPWLQQFALAFGTLKRGLMI